MTPITMNVPRQVRLAGPASTATINGEMMAPTVMIPV